MQLQLDYSLDSSNFFTASRRDLLESTLTAVVSRLDDSLASVPSRTYSVPFGTGTRQVTTSVAANTLKLYVYGAPLGGSTAGRGGSYNSVVANNAMRGQGANDFAPNISYIQFDNDGSTNWFFGSTTTGLNSNKIDFVTVARHEFLHTLGFLANQPTFSRFVQNSTFAGSNAKAANRGNAVPLTPGGDHIAGGVGSVMNDTLTGGVRDDLRNLEWGILQDLGWSLKKPPGFYRTWDLFTRGEGDGEATVKVVPSRGVYLMQLDVLAGDRLRLRTRDGSTSSERGVDSYVKIFDVNGLLIKSIDDSSTAPGKEDSTFSFLRGGTYWVGVSTYNQRNYSLTTPSTFSAPSTAFYLDATLTGKPDTEPDNIDGVTQAVVLNGGLFTTQTTLAGFDVDYYRIDAQAGTTYWVKTELPSGGGLSGRALVSVYDASGRKLAGVDGSSRYGTAIFTAPTSGRYYVQVAGYVGDDRVATNEGGIRGSWSEITLGGEYGASGNRTSGNDYTLMISTSGWGSGLNGFVKGSSGQSDFDGNGVTDFAVFQPSDARWLIQLKDESDNVIGVRTPQFGAPNLIHIPIPGDYDGNGVTDFAVFQPSDARWLIQLKDASGNVIGIRTPQFGAPNLMHIPTQAPIGSLVRIGKIPSVFTHSLSTASVSTMALAPVAAPVVILPQSDSEMQAPVSNQLLQRRKVAANQPQQLIPYHVPQGSIRNLV
ncbi:MAG: pre-peptidase C-terminal domain-containing protein [Isosphaeraceae bacterium]